jgi:hyperosmotically inducible protein
MRKGNLFSVASLLIASATLLTACDRRDDARTAGQETRDAARTATDTVADKSRDATITGAVKMRLAQDPDLSALAINVDTTDGRVVLRGSAPNAAARSKASDLATAVEGVKSVSNELSVAP